MREPVRSRVYRFLLALHPKAFREEFAAEMMWIFAQESVKRGNARLLTDAVLSLGRQWMFRSSIPEAVAKSVPAAAGQWFAWEHIGIADARLPVLRVLQGGVVASFFLVTLAFAAVQPVYRLPALHQAVARAAWTAMGLREGSALQTTSRLAHKTLPRNPRPNNSSRLGLRSSITAIRLDSKRSLKKTTPTKRSIWTGSWASAQ